MGILCGVVGSQDKNSCSPVSHKLGEDMEQAFIIMQIGNPELDRVCAEAIVPALKACGFDPKRVDKHNEGGLLKSEIIRFIEGSEIIVADLTNERPNCYLEVGYAMGVDKFRNLILTARDDHNQDSPKFQPGSAKVHFDLIGYDVLFWNAANLPAFRGELEKRVKRRLSIIGRTGGVAASAWDKDWLDRHSSASRAGLSKVGLTGLMEIRHALSPPKPNVTPSELLQAARQAEIHTFGWPIGVVLDTDQRPRPVSDGILAEIPAPNSFDYWSLRRNGDFYLLKSLFEDRYRPECILYDTRIIRVTEALLHCARLYTRLGVPTASMVRFALFHAGLKGRVLSKNVQGVGLARKSIEDEIETETQFALTEVESNLPQLVKKLVAPLLELFDFFKLRDQEYARLVDGFVAESCRS
jgi:hypothetical protein